MDPHPLRDAHVVNLLATDVMLRYERERRRSRRGRALPKDRWIVIDEVQRIPRLLDEVHLLMEERGYRKFALTGSSATQDLKRGAANLLSRRAIVRNLFPLTSEETALRGSNSASCSLRGPAAECQRRRRQKRVKTSSVAYVTTYLSEEIKAEGLVRDLGAFSRFLEVASLAAGQPTNISGIARDAGVARDTVRGYFEVLVDTLIAHWLPAYRPRAKVRERALPKLYWFDPGVLHAAAGGFDQPLPADWDGILLEHFVLHEIRSRIHYAGIKGSLGYWATPSGSEVDFVWWRGREVVAIEVKHATEPRREFRKGIEAFLAGGNARSFIVYRGERELDLDGTRVLPLMSFLRRLHAGEIVG